MLSPAAPRGTAGLFIHPAGGTHHSVRPVGLGFPSGLRNPCLALQAEMVVEVTHRPRVDCPDCGSSHAARWIGDELVVVEHSVPVTIRKRCRFGLRSC